MSKKEYTKAGIKIKERLVKCQLESILGSPTKNRPRSIMIMKATPVCLKVVAQFARREINAVKLSKFVTKPE